MKTVFPDIFPLTVSLGLALGPVGDLGPVADAAVLVKPEAGGAGVLLSLTINTGVEDVAHRGVRVRVESVQAGTQVIGALGRLWGKIKLIAMLTTDHMSMDLRRSSLSPQSTLK